mgnify:CR=1 FL=1
MVSLIFVILTNDCTPSVDSIEIEIMQALNELGEARVEENVQKVLTHYTDPFSQIEEGNTEFFPLDEYSLLLEGLFSSIDYLFNIFNNETITILDSNNAIVECDEHYKIEEGESIEESIEREKITLVKVEGEIINKIMRKGLIS